MINHGFDDINIRYTTWFGAPTVQALTYPKWGLGVIETGRTQRKAATINQLA